MALFLLFVCFNTCLCVCLYVSSVPAMTALMEFWLDTGSIIESSRQTLPLSQKQKSRQPKTTQVPSLQVSTSATKGNNCSLPSRSSDCLLSGCCWRTPRRGLNFFSLLVRRTSIALKLHSESYLIYPARMPTLPSFYTHPQCSITLCCPTSASQPKLPN